MKHYLLGLLALTAACGLQAQALAYEVSQSFEQPGTGLGFVTNVRDSINTSSFYALFVTDYDHATSTSLFVGNGAMHDYVAIYPLHTAAGGTTPALLTDADGTLATVTNIDGVNFVVAEDSRMNRYANNADPSTVEHLAVAFEPLTITSATSVRVTLAAAAPRYGERTYANMSLEASPFAVKVRDITDLSVWISVDGAAPQVIGQFRGDEADDFTTEMALDANFDGLGEGTVLTKAFQDFTFESPLDGDQLVVEVRLESRQNAEEIAFDNVRIEVEGIDLPTQANNWNLYQ